MRHLASIALVLLIGQSPVSLGQTLASQPERGTGILMGQVVDSRGQPVSGAVVTLLGGIQAIALTTDNRPIPGGPRRTLTNGNGQFAFFELTKGSYALNADKNGYLAGAYGKLRYSGQPHSIELAEAGRSLDLRITIWQHASIAGTIRDEAGEPMIGLPVQTFKRMLFGGQPHWAFATLAQTNDLGEYRMEGLPPGEYIVGLMHTQTTMPASALGPGQGSGMREVGGWSWSATSRSRIAVPDPGSDGRVLVYPTTFFPSARSIREATILSLSPGDERMAVDMQLDLVPTSLVTGTATGPDGPAQNLLIRLTNDFFDELLPDYRYDAATATTDQEGRFAFVGVPAGGYDIRAIASVSIPPKPPSTMSLYERGAFAMQPVKVTGAANEHVNVRLQNGVTVSGQLEFDGSALKPAPDLIARFSVSLEPAGPNVNRDTAVYLANFDQKGQFRIPSVPPGQYRVLFRAAAADRRLMPQWETKGATYRGQDVFDRTMTITDDVAGVAVTLTDHNSELSGAVRDAAGKPDATGAVLLFSAERDLWGTVSRRFRTVRASENGSFSIRGVPPGDYFAVAVPDGDVADWPDLQAMEQLSRTAARFSMATGERKTLDLTVRSSR